MFLHGRGKRNARRIQLRHNIFQSSKLCKEFDGYTILHLSDLHLDMAPDMTEVLSKAIGDLDYDICVITGDLRAQTFGDSDQTIDCMRQLVEKISRPVYLVLGNHDSITMVPALEQLNIKVLLNEAVELKKENASIYIAGIDDPHYFRADNIERASDQIPDEVFTILLAHSPEIYRHAAFTDFDVMLCGHTHGGQICLPGGIPVMYNADCPRRMCAGSWRYKDLQGYTSVGSGSCVVDLRFNCHPEVTLHQLEWVKE